MPASVDFTLNCSKLNVVLKALHSSDIIELQYWHFLCLQDWPLLSWKLICFSLKTLN